MAKKIDINPIKMENIGVPRDILQECESIYSKFKKMYAKYAPGKLAFFKFNSTISDNLDNLKKKGCHDIYKISVYQSYFRNCNNIENIVKTTGKILSKLDSLLEAIGTSKKASLSTLGVKGLFTKKRNYDDKLNEYYNYFNNLADNMRTTINNRNFINTEKSATKFEILNHASKPDNHQSISIDENLSRDKVKEEMEKKLESIKLDFFLTKSNISKFATNEIPSYAVVISSFLNDAITEYNNLYEIQHKLKDTYDLKGSNNNNDSNDTTKEIASEYKTYANELKYYKSDLEKSIKYLQDNSQKFEKHWDKNTKKTTINIINIKKNMRDLCNRIETNDKEIRGQFISKNNDNSNPYSNMLKSLSESMKITAEGILKLTNWVTNPEEYKTISDKSSPALFLEDSFSTIKNKINDYIKEFTSDNTINADQVKKIFNKYLKFLKQTQKEYLGIRDMVLGVYTIDVQKLNDDINRKEKQAHFDRIKNKVNVAASATGIGISILSALINLAKNF